ncbi:hypothetical protein [Aeromonas phage 1233]|nr:hypothetical protein [Aeromonas phage 1233]
MPIYYEPEVIQGSTIPVGYEYRVNGTKLELWNTSVTPEVMIMSHDVDLTTLSGSLKTALNTLYLEDAHSISSAGEDVVFKNLQSDFMFTPIWCPASADGSTVSDPVYFQYSTGLTDYFPNGNTPAMTAVVGQYAAVFPFNAVVFDFTYAAGEAYTGVITLEVANMTGGVIYRKRLPSATYAIGDQFTFIDTFSRLFDGESMLISVLKADDTPLMLKAGDDLDEPWRKAALRQFVSRDVIFADASGKLPSERLPAVGSVEIATVATLSDLYVLPVSTKFRIYIVTAENRVYYLNPNVDPSVPGNWIEGPSTSPAVLSFNNRVGAVMPQTGDYTAAMVGAFGLPLVDDGVRRVLSGQHLMVEPLSTDLGDSSVSNAASAYLTNRLNLRKHNKIKDYVFTDNYVLGEQVFLLGNLYEANGTIPGSTTFALGTTGATWKLVCGEQPGNIVSRMGNTVPAGWWLCDGSTITTPYSIYTGTAAPNLNAVAGRYYFIKL